MKVYIVLGHIDYGRENIEGVYAKKVDAELRNREVAKNYKDYGNPPSSIVEYEVE